MIWGFVLQIGISIVSSLLIRRQQQRAAARAREAARDAAAIEARIETAGTPVPLLYGYAGTRGILVFAQTLDNQVEDLFLANENDPAAFPGGKRTAGQIIKDGKRRTGDKRQFLFAQLVLGIGRHGTFEVPAPTSGTNVSGVEASITPGPTRAHLCIGEVWMDDFSDRSPSRFDDQWQLTTPAFGTARKAVSAVLRPIPVPAGIAGGLFGDLARQVALLLARIGRRTRTPESRFRGFTRADLEAWFDRDDPVFGQIPEPYMATLGRVVPYVTDAEELSTDLVFSTNPIWVLLDYMLGGVASDEFFGPRIPVEEIDLANFSAAAAIVEREKPSDLAARRFPADFQDVLGVEFDTWGEYFDAALSADGETQGGAATLPGMQAAYRGAVAIGRYHYDGSISTETDYREASRGILEAIPGALPFRSLEGKWKVAVPDPELDTSAVPTIGADVLVGLPIRAWPDAKDRLNGAKGRYVNADRGFSRDVVVFPSTEVMRRALLEEDGGQPLRETIDLPGASNPIHAYARLASHVLVSRRVRYEWETTIWGIVFEPGDVANLDPGLWSALVRITDIELTETNTVRMKGIGFHPVDYRFQMWPIPGSRLRLPPSMPCRGLSNAELRTASSDLNLISVAYGNGKVFVLDALLNVWAFDAGTGKRAQAHDISRSTIRSAMRRFSPDGMAATDDDVVRLVDSQRDVIYGFRAGARHAAADVSAATLRAYAGENDSPVQPVDIAVTGAGALLVADSSNEVIWRDGAVYVPTSAFDAFAGEQPAAVAASGSDVYVLVTRFGSRDQASIRRVVEARDGNTLTTVFTRASFSAPMGQLDLNGLAARPGCVYVGNAHDTADEVLALDPAASR